MKLPAWLFWRRRCAACRLSAHRWATLPIGPPMLRLASKRATTPTMQTASPPPSWLCSPIRVEGKPSVGRPCVAHASTMRTGPRPRSKIFTLRRSERREHAHQTQAASVRVDPALKSSGPFVVHDDAYGAGRLDSFPLVAWQDAVEEQPSRAESKQPVREHLFLQHVTSSVIPSDSHAPISMAHTGRGCRPDLCRGTPSGSL